MAKVILEVRNEDINNLTNNCILLYDAEKKEFYKTTSEEFFAKYEEKLDKLLERYDGQVLEMQRIINKMTQDNIEFMEKVKESNSKLINMVENFIKGE